MTPQIRARLKEELERAEKATTPGPYMGRSEQIGDMLLWAIYPGRSGIDGFAGKKPIAFLVQHGDAYSFIQARTSLPQLCRALEVAVGRLAGFAESALNDQEARWASRVLGEIARELGIEGEK